MTNTSKPTNRAVAALNSLLAQVSAITLKDIGLGRLVASGEVPEREIDILAHVEVFGHSHTLACQISGSSGPHQVREVLEELRSHIADLPGKVTPVLILPALSPEVRALCDESEAGCLDLHGNGRLVIDEVFVSRRALPRRPLRRSATDSASSPRRSPVAPDAEESSAKSVSRGFPPARADLTHSAPHFGGRSR